MASYVYELLKNKKDSSNEESFMMSDLKHINQF